MEKGLEKVKIFFSGCLMGVSDALPGISGATIALILDIYEKLIKSISYFFSNIFHPLKLIRSKEFKFLINLYAGVLIALLLSLGIIGGLLHKYEVAVFSFFIGLILASIWIIFRRNSGEVLKNIHYLFVGALGGYLLFGVGLIASSHEMGIVFIAGFLAISAMILPGISGSYILLMMGQYEFIARSVVEINLVPLLMLSIGMIGGLFVMSKLLRKLLRDYHGQTMVFLIGLMIGGLRAPLTRIWTGASLGEITKIIMAAGIGAVLILAIDRAGK